MWSPGQDCYPRPRGFDSRRLQPTKRPDLYVGRASHQNRIATVNKLTTVVSDEQLRHGQLDAPHEVGSTKLLISARELAELLSVSLVTVRRMDSASKLPRPVRLGGSVRWRRDEIEAWVLSGCVGRCEWESVWQSGTRKDRWQR